MVGIGVYTYLRGLFFCRITPILGKTTANQRAHLWHSLKEGSGQVSFSFFHLTRFIIVSIWHMYTLKQLRIVFFLLGVLGV